jgi:hypothetical protein
VTGDAGRVAPKAPPARLWWIMLAWAAAVMGILAGVLVLAREALQDVLSADVVLELALGVALLLADRATRPVAIAAGLWAIVGGTIMLVDALALRRMGRVFG